MTDTYQTIRTYVDRYLDSPDVIKGPIAAETKEAIAKQLTFHLSCLAIRLPVLKRPELFKRAIEQISRHVLRDTAAPSHPSRLKSLYTYVDALTVLPKLLEQHPSVAAVVRAWRRELKSVMDQLTALPQPHRPIRWESADGHYRLTELIHPAHLAYQGLHQHNCLVRTAALITHRQKINVELAKFTPTWPFVETGAARLFSLDTIHGPEATFHIFTGLLMDAEAPMGALLNPTRRCWEPALAAMKFMADEEIMCTLDPMNERTAPVAKAILPQCGNLTIRSNAWLPETMYWRGRVVMTTGGRA